MGRTGETIFTVIFAGTSSPQALAYAHRLRDQLEKAQVKFREQLLKIRLSMGLAALDADTAASLEDLMKLALQRLQRAAAGVTERIVAKDEAALDIAKPSILPSDVERAVQTLETANADDLGDAAYHALQRLMPFVAAVCERLGARSATELIRLALKDQEASRGRKP